MGLYEFYEGVNLRATQVAEIGNQAVAVTMVRIDQLQADFRAGERLAEGLKAAGQFAAVSFQGVAGFASLGIDELAGAAFVSLGVGEPEAQASCQKKTDQERPWFHREFQ